MFDAMTIASRSHKDNGNGGCTCGETIVGCWWHAIYFPYLALCMDAKYAEVFGEV